MPLERNTQWISKVAAMMVQMLGSSGQAVKKMLREYRKNIWKDRQKTTAKIAAACVVILVVAPVAVNAATNGELFSRIWGTAGHKNVPAHDEVIDDGKGGKLDVTYPERTFENTDTKKAEELIGKAVSYPDITTSVDGTTITIVSAVRDKNAAVVEFTMEKKGGVDVLQGCFLIRFT